MPLVHGIAASVHFLALLFVVGLVGSTVLALNDKVPNFRMITGMASGLGVLLDCV